MNILLKTSGAHSAPASALQAAIGSPNMRSCTGGASPSGRQEENPLSFLERLFGKGRQSARLQPLYRSIVAVGRDPVWYRDGEVPDTVDGRFDMIATILSLVLIRLERGGDAARADSALLAELFIADMDGNIRQMGTGDLMVGKHVGKMMGAVGGRIGTMRTALESGEGLDGAVGRNIFHDKPPSEAAVSLIAARLGRLHTALSERPIEAVMAGDLPSA